MSNSIEDLATLTNQLNNNQIPVDNLKLMLMKIEKITSNDEINKENSEVKEEEIEVKEKRYKSKIEQYEKIIKDYNAYDIKIWNEINKIKYANQKLA